MTALERVRYRLTVWWFTTCAVAYRPVLVIAVLGTAIRLFVFREYGPWGIAIALPWTWHVESWDDPWTREHRGPGRWERYVTFYARRSPVHHDVDWIFDTFCGPAGTEADRVTLRRTQPRRPWWNPAKPEGSQFVLI